MTKTLSLSLVLPACLDINPEYIALYSIITSKGLTNADFKLELREDPAPGTKAFC